MIKTCRLTPFIVLLLSLSACSDRSNPLSRAEHDDILARLDALEAESEIRHKLQTYMAALDHAMASADWDDYMAYFTQDAKLIMSEGTRTGQDDIRERMSTAAVRLNAAAAQRPARQQADLLSSIEVEVHGDTASSRARYTFIAEDGNGGFTVTGSGLYIDEWAIEDGEWRIASRTIDYDLLRLP